MYKSLIAGITAISLTITAANPAQAQGLNEEQIGKIIFGLFATAAVASIINNQQEKSERVEEPARNTWQPRPRGERPRDQFAVPRRCLATFQTRTGSVRMFERGCMRENYRRVAQLPRSCAVRSVTRVGARGGWDPQCLRDEGYYISRRR